MFYEMNGTGLKRVRLKRREIMENNGIVAKTIKREKIVIFFAPSCEVLFYCNSAKAISFRELNILIREKGLSLCRSFLEKDIC